jgi:hypothetical protein
LFYDRYSYCVHFKLQELTSLRHKSTQLADHSRINATLDRRQAWTRRLRNPGGSWQNPLSFDITQETRDNLHDFRRLLQDYEGQFRLFIFGDWGYLYTNNLDLIDTVDNKIYIGQKKYTEAHITRPRNTIALRDPQYQLRTHFKSILLNEKEREFVTNYLRNQGNSIRMSPALDYWVNHGGTVLQSYFFIDHDSSSVLSMMNLVRPGLVRGTQSLIKA